MTYTTHGHHIPGTDRENIPTEVTNCGGVGICFTCSAQTVLTKPSTKGFSQRRVAKFEIEVILDDVPGWGNTEEDWLDHLNNRCIPAHYFHSVKHISTEKKVINKQ